MLSGFLFSVKSVKCEPKTKHLFSWNNINIRSIKAAESSFAQIVKNEGLFCMWTMKRTTIYPMTMENATV